MTLGHRIRVFLRRVVRLATVAASGAFGWMVVQEIRAGLLPEEVGILGESVEQNGDVVSNGIRVVQVDERGRRIAEISAEESIAASGSERRFRGVLVRFLETHGEEDTIVEADELLLHTERESFQFLGHVLLSSTDLDLAGPELQLRRNPDRLTAPEPMLIRTGNFHGVAGSLDFQLSSGLAILRGVAVVADDPEGIVAVADVARVDQMSGDIHLLGDVEVASSGFRLRSSRTVELRRDPVAGRVTGLSSGFDTSIEVLEESDAAAVLTARGDEVDMDLDRRRRPRIIHITGGASFTDPENGEARGESAETRFDADGNPAALHLVTDVRTRVVAPGTDNWIQAEAVAAHVGFNEDGSLGSARYWGGVEIRHANVSASAASATWDGANTLALKGTPRIEDRALLELHGEDMRIELGSPGRIVGDGGVVGRLLAGKAGWLPGSPEGVSIIGDRAEIETGSGKARFSGRIRMAFQESRLTAGALSLDAGARTFVMDGGVDSLMQFGKDDENPIAFSVRSESLRHGVDGLEYSGAPVLEHRSRDIENRLEAQRIVAEIDEDRNLSRIVGSGSARFQRGTSRVSGNRIRFDPGAEMLQAFGTPAVVESGAKRSEGGEVAIALDADRWDILPSSTRRTETTLRVQRR